MVTRTAERRPYGAIGRIGVVVGMHVGALYLIAVSLGMAPPLPLLRTEAVFIPDAVDPDPPPQRFEPTDVRPDIPQLPVPDIVIPVDDPAPSDSITADLQPLDRIPLQQPGSAIPQPVIALPQVDPRRPLSRPAYPPEIIRMNGEGSTVVEIYVLENGRVGDARILKSSGFEALDRATLAEARRNWRLKPATRDGVPFAQWYRLSVAFRLADR